MISDSLPGHPSDHFANPSKIEALIGQSVGKVGVRAVGSERPSFQLKWRDSFLGPTWITELRGIQIERTEGALADKWSDFVFLVVQQEGQASCNEAGMEFCANAGDIILVDPCLSSRIGSASPSRFASFCLPRNLVTSLQGRGLKALHTVIGHGSSATRLLSGTLNSMLEPGPVDERSSRIALQIVRDLLAAALDAQEGAAGDQDQALIASMREWATQRAGFNRVDIPGLARKFALSERSLYRLLAQNGTTPDRLLWRCRLDAATSRIERDEASIKTIALEAGFKNVSHFSRLFREVHGVPPSAYRCRL